MSAVPVEHPALDVDAAPDEHDAVRAVADRVRERVVRMCSGPEGGHLGGSLSAVDVLATLYVRTLRIDAHSMREPDPHSVVLSKGHAGAALYAVLAEQGVVAPEHLDRYGEPGSLLGGHPSPSVPGIDLATGSLGHGLGLGVGLALGRRLQGRSGRVVVVMGDGELQEGAVWESAVVASARRLGRLTVVVDRNGLQQSKATVDVLHDVDPCAPFSALGWRLDEVDGHDLGALAQVLDDAGEPTDRPHLVVAHTHKARGVGFLEDKVSSHFVSLDERRLARCLRAVRASSATAPGRVEVAP